MLETFTAIDSASLGGRIKRKPVTAHPYSEFVGAISLEKQKKVIAFLEDYEKIFSLLARVLKPGKLLVLDVADKNPKYKSQEHQTEADTEPTPYSNDGTNTNDDAKQDEKRTKDNTCNAPAGDTSENSTTATKTQAASASNAYEPSGNYSPKKLTQKSLVFTKVEGQIIDDLVGQDDLSNKIHDLVFELYKLDLQVHRHAIAYLFRALLESATKYLSRRQTKVQFNEKALETSVVSAWFYS